METINITKEDKEHLKNTKGKVLGRAILDHITVLNHRYGDDVRNNIEKQMKSIGYEIDLSKLKVTDKLPISYYMAFFIVEKQIFNLDDEGVREMGRATARLSFFLRFASKYLVSLEMLANNSQIAWDKYYQKEGGKLRITELNKEQKFLAGELTDFWGHPIHCRYVEGYFEQVVTLVTGKKTICREEKCPFDKTNNVHYFVARWD